MNSKRRNLVSAGLVRAANRLKTRPSLARSPFPGVCSLLALVILSSCAIATSEDSNQTGLETDLQRLLGRILDTSEGVPGAMLHVDLAHSGFSWSGALGVSDTATGEPLRPNQVLRVASNTKSYVAAAVLRLAEEGRLDLDSPVSRVLSAASTEVLREGGYDPDRIVVRMLLNHTSGLWDYATADSFFERVLIEPEHRWTRAEQLDFAMTEGAPVGSPGEAFLYSDTGYILLGEILEQRTGQPINVAVRELLRLGSHDIRHTWFEGLDPVPPSAPPRVHQYAEGLDTYSFDPSMDLWGGGGLVSTLQDMARFYRALLQDQVFDRSETLEMMLEISEHSLPSTGGGYGMGISREELHGFTCYGHGGFWGTVVRHCPAPGVTVAAAVTSTSDPDALRALLDEAIRLAIGATAVTAPTGIQRRWL